MVRIPVYGLAMATASIVGSMAIGVAVSGKGGQIIDRLLSTSSAPTLARPAESSAPTRAGAAANADRRSASQSAKRDVAVPAPPPTNNRPATASVALGTPALSAGAAS